jgi:transcriptional regulator with XRE-family HTH domain
MVPQEPQKRCFSCGSLYCGIHLHTSSTRYSTTGDEGLFTCAYCLDENSVPASNKRKKEEQEDDLSLERDKKRPKIANHPPTTSKLSLHKEKKAAISVEMMNQIISSLSPSAPPLHIQAAPVRKKKRADVRETPDQHLIKQIKDALVTQQLHQKDLADILEVSPSTISSYFNNKSRSNGWKDLETKLSEWVQNGASGSGEVPSKSDDSPSPVPDSHSMAHSTVRSAQAVQHTVSQSHSHQAVIKQTTNITSVMYESGTGKVEATSYHTSSPPPQYYNMQGYTPQVANVYQQNAKMEPFDSYEPEPNEKAGYYTQTNYQAAVSGYGYAPTPSLSMMDGFQVNPQLMMQRFGYRRDPNQPFNSNMHGNRQSGLQ